MASSNSKFPGILGAPRKHNPILEQIKKNKFGIISSEMMPHLQEIETKTDMEMTELLLKHYNINIHEKNYLSALCLKLAIDFVPGFKYEKNKRGARIKWTEEKNQYLVSTIESYIKEHPHLKAPSACVHFAKRGTFCISNNKSLLAQYRKSKKQLKK